MVSETEITLQYSGSQILVFALFIQVCTGLYALLSSLLIVCCAQQVCSFTWYDLYNMIDTSEYDFNMTFLELKANYYAPFYNM